MKKTMYLTPDEYLLLDNLDDDAGILDFPWGYSVPDKEVWKRAIEGGAITDVVSLDGIKVYCYLKEYWNQMDESDEGHSAAETCKEHGFGNIEAYELTNPLYDETGKHLTVIGTELCGAMLTAQCAQELGLNPLIMELNRNWITMAEADKNG